MTTHLLILTGERTGPIGVVVAPSGKAGRAACGALSVYEGPGLPRDIGEADCDTCLLLQATMRANIGEALGHAPFSRSGLPTLAAWFFVHRILGTYPACSAWARAWNRWIVSPAFRHLQEHLGAAQSTWSKYTGCALCGCPHASQMGPPGACRICGVRGVKMARAKETKLSPVKEAALLDDLLSNGCTLGQARRALKALKPGAHALDRAEWERIPWSSKVGGRAPRGFHTLPGLPPACRQKRKGKRDARLNPKYPR